MKIRKFIYFISTTFTIILSISGCSIDNSNSIDSSNALYSTPDTVINIEETTEKKITYNKQGFFTPTEKQAEEIAQAVVADEDVWQEGLERDQIYFMEFADLNFDGKLEFVVCDTLYEDKATFHANAYYLDNGQLKKAEVIDEINPMDGYDNYYTAYFDKKNGEYVVIGYNNIDVNENNYENIVYKLIFDGKTIRVEHLLNKSAYTTDNTTYENDIYTYYKFENEAAVEINEKEYESALSDLEENDDWVEIINSPVKTRNLKYDDYYSAYKSDRVDLLKEAVFTISYDRYVAEDTFEE